MSQIPKIIHQLWLGDKPIPEHCKKFTEEMQKLLFFLLTGVDIAKKKFQLYKT